MTRFRGCECFLKLTRLLGFWIQFFRGSTDTVNKRSDIGCNLSALGARFEVVKEVRSLLWLQAIHYKCFGGLFGVNGTSHAETTVAYLLTEE
jgi:hypothetical protein